MSACPPSLSAAAIAPAEALRAACERADRILLTGPLDPDGDSIGACLALARGIAAVSDAHVDVAGTPSYRYAWMPGAEAMIPDARIKGDYDLAIVLDGDRHRLAPEVDRVYRTAGMQVIVDHHRSTGPNGYDLTILDPSAASTCEMVLHLLDAWGVPLDRDLAALIYTGIIFDTGGFRHSNTTPDTHRLAARLLETGIDPATIAVRVLVERSPAGLRLLGEVLRSVTFHGQGKVAVGAVRLADVQRFHAIDGDLEGIVDALVYTHGVEAACLCVEKSAGKVKLSLRSRSDVDVSRVAHALAPSGGGHPRAAGVALDKPLEEVLARVPAVLVEAVEAT